MRRPCRLWFLLSLLFCVLMAGAAAFARSQDEEKANRKEQPANLAVHWDKFTSV